MPAGTPMKIVDILSGAVGQIAKSDDFINTMARVGLAVRYMDAKQYAAYWAEDEKRNGPILQEAKQEGKK